MTQRFTRLEALVPFARRRAERGIYNGQMSSATRELLRACSHYWAPGVDRYATVLYTRDAGHHTGGWWKNPDYERCLHLSVAWRDAMRGRPIEHDHDRTAELARAFFGDDARHAWIEGPYSPEGKTFGVFHYRLFCDPSWAPIQPRGEVYSREHTPADWRSFSEIHGWSPREDQAPFLMAQGDAP